MNISKKVSWYQKKPRTTKDFDELTQTYNEKYGDYDYGSDSRSIDSKFEEIFIKTVGNLSGKKVLVCGSNSGYEIEILSKMYPDALFTALDISSDALKKLSYAIPDVRCIHGTMEKLPFNNDDFDFYLNCRAIHSSNIDMIKVLIEAMRVTKGDIVISISNGYVVNNKLVLGMFDYKKKSIDRNKPKEIESSIKQFLVSYGCVVNKTQSQSEIFLRVCR